MKTTRQTYINMHRDAWVEVNLGALEKNIKIIKNFIDPKVKTLAVVKADGYGHGSIMLAPTMLASGIDMLGVASIDEGLDLRSAKINCEILVLGAVPIWAFECAIENDITLSVFSKEHILACKQAFERCGKKIKVFIKIDTGMNRIGIETQNAADFIKTVQNCNFIDLQGIFSHLSCAENEEITKKQLAQYQDIVSQANTKGLILHVLNTAGIFAYPQYQYDMVRAGIGLYGLMPDLPCKQNINLTPLMSLKGRITRIHTMKKEEGISYGHTYKAPKDMTVATIPIGYADGVPRALSNKIYGKLEGINIKQIGSITMDQMMFDITGINAQEGDVITLIGEDLTIDNWANILNTINYELTCRLKVRLPRVYTR